jgi:sarcosine oxidase gamma subunit
MTDLEFLEADPLHPGWRSPLRRALAGAPSGVRDVTAEAVSADVSALGPAAGVAGIEIDTPFAARLLARMTDLDLDALPAIGSVAHVRTRVERHAEARFRLWFGQEYSDYLAEVVLDAWHGLEGVTA